MRYERMQDALNTMDGKMVGMVIEQMGTTDRQTDTETENVSENIYFHRKFFVVTINSVEPFSARVL